MPRTKDELVFERSKEVEEWLMGSGESDATTGSSGSNHQQLEQKAKQKTELEKPIQPACQANDDNCSDGEEGEDWMFKTFDPFKGGKKPQPPPKQSVRNRVTELEETDDFGESPFDMAPEMSK
jgi:hypothetical protein